MEKDLEKYKKIFNEYHVLIVDDAVPMRNMIKFMLKKIGFNTLSEAENGSEAFGLLKKLTIDLVVADWNMPKLNGYQLLEKIRADESLKYLPVIIVSGEGDKEHIVSIIRAGASDYVLKPIPADIFLKKVIKYAIRSVAH
ncbi:response regulator [Solidesulfovibrio magneticus]|uniref:Chemotaxis protein CheY n=1 Tax=Solidesulfovibrio magneticus (strain ATCC 700980 / DSM 13731 / RS-1) TaxID=573370 RepID=C4XKQ6_SOLM1|nr:response regulator [Solidesulfovibrio magneticus]BAH74447.1 chemotaxis protein CheY [Solidesulfovibrio magneticus RS-1]